MDGGYDKQIHENNKKFRWSGQILWKKVLKNRCKEIEKKTLDIDLLKALSI